MEGSGLGRRLTVHHVTPHFYPEVGGLEESVRRFGAWLVKRGYRVVVHTSSIQVAGHVLAPRDMIDGIEVRRYDPVVLRGYFRTWFHPDLSGAQLVHLHGYAVRTNDRVMRDPPSVPVVYSLHHGVRMRHVSATTRVLRRIYDRLVGLPTLRRVDRLLVASNGDRAWLVAHHLAADRIRILPTPLPDDAFLPANAEWARGHVGSRRYVLYLGRLHEEKGVDALLETMPQLPEDVDLVYAGPDGGRLAALRERARRLRVDGRVHFLGIVTEDQKRSLLAASAVLALPSLFEAQGLAVLEAWAQGRPVVASRVGALAELVVPHESGLLVPEGDVAALADALGEVLSSHAKANDMGRRGQQEAERFRLEPLGHSLEAVYQEVIQR